MQTSPDAAVPRTSNRVLWAYLIVFFIVWTLRATVFYSIDRQVPEGLARNLYSNGVKLLIWVVPAFLYVRYREGSDPWCMFKLTTPVSWSTAGYALAGMCFVLITVGGNLWLAGRNVLVVALHNLPFWGLALGAAAITPLLEEIVFRGFIQQELAERMAFWKANLLTSSLFALVHAPLWISTRGLTGAVLADLAGVFVLGLVLGYLVRRSNSLWPAVAVHLFNNVLVGVVLPG